MTREEVNRTLRHMEQVRMDSYEADSPAEERRLAAEYGRLSRVVEPYLSGRQPYSDAEPVAVPPAAEPKPRYVWLSDEYSVPLATLCWHAAPSPNADHACIRAKGHPGKHLHRIATGLDLGGVECRDYSHRDPRP